MEHSPSAQHGWLTTVDLWPHTGMLTAILAPTTCIKLKAESCHELLRNHVLDMRHPGMNEATDTTRQEHWS